MTTIGLRLSSNAFCSTKRVCGIGPSKASTNSSTPSAIFSTRSTSPPKSAWPGVSITLILQPLYSMATFFAKMVIPRSRSSSLLSRMSSPFCSFSRKRLAVYNILSTKVVLPWSTCAMMAIFLMFCIFFLCAHMYAHIAHITKKPAKVVNFVDICK